jgi:hypothetical protein
MFHVSCFMFHVTESAARALVKEQASACVCVYHAIISADARRLLQLIHVGIEPSRVCRIVNFWMCVLIAYGSVQDIVYIHIYFCVQPAMAKIIKKRTALLEKVFIKYAEADKDDPKTSTMSLKELFTLMTQCGQIVSLLLCQIVIALDLSFGSILHMKVKLAMHGRSAKIWLVPPRLHVM